MKQTLSKSENITKAYEHYQNRKNGRPRQTWVSPDGKILVNETIKGALPIKV